MGLASEFMLCGVMAWIAITLKLIIFFLPNTNSNWNPIFFIFLNKEILLLKKVRKEKNQNDNLNPPLWVLDEDCQFCFVLTETVEISHINILTRTRNLSFHLSPNSNTFWVHSNHFLSRVQTNFGWNEIYF